MTPSDLLRVAAFRELLDPLRPPLGPMSFHPRTATSRARARTASIPVRLRCRACGGDLAPTRDAFVTCRFCRTQNVLAADLARDAARRLDGELAAYRAQANGVLAGTSHAGTHMTRTFFVCFAVVYVGMFALGALARVAFAALGGAG